MILGRDEVLFLIAMAKQNIGTMYYFNDVGVDKAAKKLKGIEDRYYDKLRDGGFK